jgi:hypothetical protein
MGGAQFDMHLLVKASPGQLRQTGCVMRISLVRLQCFQTLMRLPCVDANDGNTQSTQPVADCRRHATGFDHRAFDAADLVQYMCDHVGSALALIEVIFLPLSSTMQTCVVSIDKSSPA